eukprot:508127-Pelagomonas_calceolata.AAC.4
MELMGQGCSSLDCILLLPGVPETWCCYPSFASEGSAAFRSILEDKGVKMCAEAGVSLQGSIQED